MTIAAVIVTYNRLNLLKKCINAVCHQTYKPDEIIVVNNGSTDGTTEWLSFQTNLSVVHQENSGGAGGFSTGYKTAYDKGHDWAWLMDDDAEPEIHCLENFVRLGLNKNYAYVPFSLDPTTKELAWPIVILDKDSGKRKYIEKFNQVTDKISETDISGPGFLGSLCHRQVVELAGYPNTQLFIKKDEEEFNLRVYKAGIKSIFVKDAVIYHPSANLKPIEFLGRRTYYYAYLEPWKAFYLIRNTIYIQVYLKRDFKGSIMSIVFFLGTMLFEDRKLKRIPLYTRAIKDGFMGKLGKTVTPS